MNIHVRRLDSEDHPFVLDISAGTAEDRKLLGEIFNYLADRKGMFALGRAIVKPFKEDAGRLSLMAHPRPPA